MYVSDASGTKHGKGSVARSKGPLEIVVLIHVELVDNPLWALSGPLAAECQTTRGSPGLRTTGWCAGWGRLGDCVCTCDYETWCDAAWTLRCTIRLRLRTTGWCAGWGRLGDCVCTCDYETLVFYLLATTKHHCVSTCDYETLILCVLATTKRPERRATVRAGGTSRGIFPAPSHFFQNPPIDT
jgi:hypothetical protein